MDSLGAVCTFMQCVWPTLARRIGYVKDPSKKFKKLTEAVEDLCKRKDDLNGQINRQRPLKEPSNVCRGWMKKVEEIEDLVKSIEAEIASTRRCLNIGCCFPDVYSRMNLGKRIRTMLKHVSGLKQARSDFKGDELVDAPLPIVDRRQMSLAAEKIESIDRIVQNLLDCLREEKNQMIGLWGMGGIGKTTVMKRLNNRIEDEFEIVVWVTVSKEWTIRKLQNEIADRLKIPINDNESDETVARRIHLNLQRKKFLLLLDDVWRQVDLATVGIPRPSKEIGSKIVLTSRLADVCNEMETDLDIKVNPLSEEEAWSLFCGKVGEAASSRRIEPIARKIVRECAGLPLAILVIGGSLRKVSNIHVWGNFLDELKSATFGIGSMEELVLKQLKFSYDRLKNDGVRNCFLYCAVYPEDWVISVDELVGLWRAEGFIVRMKTLEQEYNKAHTILNGLINDSLLERSGNGVKMHDMVRDMALRLTQINGDVPPFLVRAGEEIDKSPNVEEWEKAERISLMETKIGDLPRSPRCNSLSTLLLRSPWMQTIDISSSFFQYMHSLRVLQIHHGAKGIRALPSSVSSLVNLRGLHITCNAHHVSLPSEIGELTRLEVMYITVGLLPLEVSQLTSLRSLRIRFVSVEGMRTMCSDGVISSLHLLEDLRIYFLNGMYGKLNLLSQWHEMAGMVVADELSTLKHLTSLYFRFSTTKCLRHFLKQREKNNCPQLRDFVISVAVGEYVDELEVTSDYRQEMGKKLVWFSGEKVSVEISSMLLSQTYNLRLRDHKTVGNLLDFGIETINTLEVCRVEKCLKMEAVLDGSGCSRNALSPNLHKLILIELPRLTSICDPPYVFSKLTELDIHRCPKLRYVFTKVTIRQISNLKYLRIFQCEEMEEIVALEDEVDDTRQICFPRLERISLEKNPKLLRIWNGASQVWPSLQELMVYSCPNLKTLNLKVMDTASVLKNIQGKREWWQALEWEDHDGKHLLQPIYSEIYPYGSRKDLMLSSYMLRSKYWDRKISRSFSFPRFRRDLADHDVLDISSSEITSNFKISTKILRRFHEV